MLLPKTLPSSSHHHYWVLAVLCKVIFVATPQLSVTRPGRVGHLKQSSVFTGGNPSHSSNQHPSPSQTTLLISACVLKLRQGATGKRRPDKHRVDWDIGVTQVRCSEGLLTPIAVSRFVLFKIIE